MCSFAADFELINRRTILDLIQVYRLECFVIMLEDFLERTVIVALGIKTWHLVFMIVAAACILIIVICCIFRCRIPRTRQEIEADIVRTRVCSQFRKHLDRLPIDDLQLLTGKVFSGPTSVSVIVLIFFI